MRASFNIDYEWLPGDGRDEAEGWMDAALAINVGPWCATELEDTLARTVRRSARLSALHLAEWFAANWWRLLWEPRADTYSWKTSHKVGNAGNGYVWPDLSFSSDWQWMHVASRPTARREAEPVRYLSHFDHPISLGDFERGLDDFMEGALGRLSSIRRGASNLNSLWTEVAGERGDPEMSALRTLEACMGYDPDEAPSHLLDGLRRHMDSFGTSAVREMAAAYRQDTMELLKYFEGHAGHHDAVLRVPQCNEIRSSLGVGAKESDVPWRRAEQAARIARETWGIGLPISTETLCDIMQITQADFLDVQSLRWPSFFLAGFRESSASDELRVAIGSKHGTSRRFGLARLVADHIAAGEEDRLLPGTACSTSRQKFQRAFAQELFCPVEALREHVGVETPSSDDIHDAAQYFDVSPLTVHATFVNKGVLGRETLDRRVA